jgi:hypothetical protein
LKTNSTVSCSKHTHTHISRRLPLQ